ncbi:putative ribonuclease H-like domain-containing protein [Tanacetum coccineum]
MQINNTNNIHTVSPTVSAGDIENNVVDKNIVYGCIDNPNIPNLEEIFYSDDDEEVGAEADMNNLATNVFVSPIPTTRDHKDHLLEQIIGDIHSAPQTKRMTKNVTEHEEGIDYDEVFALVARIEAIRLFFAYASFMGFSVYQMGVKSAFLYGTIEEEVYVCQPPSFEDPHFPDKVYKVEKALYGLHQALRAWGAHFTSVAPPIETNKGIAQGMRSGGRGGEDVDVYLYRSMIGSLMYLTAFRPDIMFAIYACARRRLISWQCKKQTIVANSTTEVEYVAASSYYGQVLWIQNQMLDYGYNFMNTKIFIDNESTICIVKHPVFQSKTKHIEIRHHFIRDSYEKRLIQVIKIHTDHNVVNLLIKSSRPIPLAVDEIVIKEWEDIMERAATTASSLEAEQDSDNINRT